MTQDLTRSMEVPTPRVEVPIKIGKKEKGVIKPSVDLYQDEGVKMIGPKVEVTTKGGTDIQAGIEKTQYKDYDDPPTKYDFSVGKSGDKYSYGITGSKRGKQKSITIGGKIKYSSGGLARGMGAAIKGGKFEGVK
jgi:hypothetical protein|tara:strand:+ start:16 stop:420 length:405 start_codon:yes stop_codon:yes gene_type:complete